jgi:predicted transport protein
MYKIEYLIIGDKKVKTKSIRSLKNLLQADDDIELKNKKFKVRNYEGDYTITTGNIKNAKQEGIYFHLTFSCQKEEDIEAFVTALKEIKKGLYKFSQKHVYVLWDDVSYYYSHKAYVYIHKVENLMRKLLSKFMLVNVGIKWEENYAPLDVRNSIRQENKDVNFLTNLDFIKLSDFLFSENYPKHKEDIIRKLKGAQSLENIDLEEIQSLLPNSNWSKFFSAIVDQDGNYIKKRWEKLYDLRNKVAHNKEFKLLDLQDVQKLTEDINPYLEDALAKLDEVVVTEEQIEDVVTEVVSEGQPEVIDFLDWMKKLEHSLRKFYQVHVDAKNYQTVAVKQLIEAVKTFHRIDPDVSAVELDSLSKKIETVFDLKKRVNSAEFRAISQHIDSKTYVHKLQKAINNYIPYQEDDHLSSIKDTAITALYQQLKSQLLALGLDFKVNKYYLSFTKEESNITDVQIQQKGLKVWFKASKGSLSDPGQLLRDVSKVGHLGNGDYELTISDAAQLSTILHFVQQVIDLHTHQQSK